jgi:hypothetical protein
MKRNPNSESVFQRMRQQRREGLRFVPTPVPAASIELARPKASELRVYASPMEFADHTGVGLTEINRMVDQGELTHILFGLDRPMVHVRKGLADLERKERGPSVAKN